MLVFFVLYYITNKDNFFLQNIGKIVNSTLIVSVSREIFGLKEKPKLYFKN